MSNRSCQNCNLQTICTIYQSIYKTIIDHSKTQTIIHSDDASWIYVFKSLARCCTKFDSFDKEFQHLATENINNYIIKLVKQIKKDKSFVNNFLNATSPEKRLKVVESKLEENEEEHMSFLLKELQNDEDNAQNFYENFSNMVITQFGV